VRLTKLQDCLVAVASTVVLHRDMSHDFKEALSF
jgi:hypothetical protein